MAVINSDQISNGTPIGGVGQGGAQHRSAYFRVTVPAGTTTTDSIVLGYVPPHSMVDGGALKSDALGGTTTLNVGDSGIGTAIAADADRYFAATNIVNAGGVVTTLAATGMFFKNTTAQKLPITAVFAGGTTTTTGVVEVALRYLVEEPQQ